MTTQELITKYKKYIANIQWHVENNKPTGDELQKCLDRLRDYREVVRDLEAALDTVIPKGVVKYITDSISELTKIHGGVNRTAFYGGSSFIVMEDSVCYKVAILRYNNETSLDAAVQPDSRQEGEDWVSVEDAPLFTIDKNGNCECTEVGTAEFWAAVPYSDNTRPERKDLVWIRHCIVEDGIGLCVVGDTDNEPAGWELSQVQYYIPIKLPQVPPRKEGMDKQ